MLLSNGIYYHDIPFTHLTINHQQEIDMTTLPDKGWKSCETTKKKMNLSFKWLDDDFLLVVIKGYYCLMMILHTVNHDLIYINNLLDVLIVDDCMLGLPAVER